MAGRAVYTKMSKVFGAYAAKQALYGNGAVVDYLRENNTSLAQIQKGIADGVKNVAKAQTPLERANAFGDAKRYAQMKSDVSTIARTDKAYKADQDGSKTKKSWESYQQRKKQSQSELREMNKRRREMLSKR